MSVCVSVWLSRSVWLSIHPSGCQQLLSFAAQIISKKHSWSLSTKNTRSEPAWFVNALVPGAVEEGTYRPFNLAQGPMQCCAVWCSSCGSEIGWRFGLRAQAANDKLLSYEGRYGLVQSACVSVAGPVAPKSEDSAYGLEGDAEDDEDPSSWRMRVPMALLQHLFGLRDSGDTLDLETILREARRPPGGTGPGSPISPP